MVCVDYVSQKKACALPMTPISTIYDYSDFNEQEDFIYQLKQEKQKLKDGKHAYTVWFSNNKSISS